MKKNGFTLIELIGVVVIMGIVLLMVFPATSRIIRDNSNKKYDHYYNIVKSEIDKYAKTRRDDIGGIDGRGCIKTKPSGLDAPLHLSYLIEQEYVKAFDDENVLCVSPGELGIAQLSSYGIDPNKRYVDIKISNELGEITTEFSMVCIKDNKLVYSKLVEDSGICNRYVADLQDSLVAKIDETLQSTLDSETGRYYIKGTETKNYVWYSGKMWRIVDYSKSDKTVKLVLDENITLLTYDAFSNDFRSSNIRLWLNDNFLKTLKNPSKYILDYEWNYTPVSNGNLPPKANTTVAKVGLLTYYDYDKVKGFLNIGKAFWLLSNTNSGSNWYVDSSNTLRASATNEFYGVRPVIVLKPNITYILGGEGTKTNPFRLVGDLGANIGTQLNTRLVGEYVTYNGLLYRIAAIENNLTKLIANEPLSDPTEIQFHYYDNIYSNNTYIGQFLTSWSVPLNDKLTSGDFCRKIFNKSTSATAGCSSNDILSLKVGIPKVGDMFTANSSREYWTLSNFSTELIDVIEPDGTLGTKKKSGAASIRPVIVIKENVVIRGGNGTERTPYIINDEGNISSPDLSVTVTFNSNGGTLVNPITIYKGTTILDIPIPQYEAAYNVAFAGWFDEEGNQLDTSTEIFESKTYYARWNITDEEKHIIDIESNVVNNATVEYRQLVDATSHDIVRYYYDARRDQLYGPSFDTKDFNAFTTQTRCMQLYGKQSVVKTAITHSLYNSSIIESDSDNDNLGLIIQFKTSEFVIGNNNYITVNGARVQIDLIWTGNRYGKNDPVCVGSGY